MRAAAVVVCFVGALVCGGWMWFYYLAALQDWLGTIVGIVVAVLIIPGAAIFPFVYWIVEGHVPTLYLVVWGAGVTFMVGAGLLRPDR